MYSTWMVWQPTLTKHNKKQDILYDSAQKNQVVSWMMYNWRQHVLLSVPIVGPFTLHPTKTLAGFSWQWHNLHKPSNLYSIHYQLAPSYHSETLQLYQRGYSYRRWRAQNSQFLEHSESNKAHVQKYFFISRMQEWNNLESKITCSLTYFKNSISKSITP